MCMVQSEGFAIVSLDIAEESEKIKTKNIVSNSLFTMLSLLVGPSSMPLRKVNRFEYLYKSDELF